MQSPAVVSVSNTIVAGNTATNSGPDLGGAITSNDHNLVGDTSGATFTSQANDITGVDPLLDTLKDNGGRTQTHALLTGSPAIDAGETTLTSDQRGVARPQGAADDIGAFEVEAACPTFPVNVASEDELNFAIACYNAKTVAGTYTIILTQNINLTASTTVIDNATAGVELLIEGGDYAVDGQNIGGVRAFTVLQDTTVSIQNMTITRCNVADTVVPGDPNAAAGGAVLVRNGTLTIRSSTLSNNIGTFGGAINNAVGNVTVIDSTLSNNQAITSSVPAVAFGAAIANNGSENEASSLTLINTTVSGNHTPLRGAGIYNGPDAVFTAINSTISGNQADVGGGVVNQPDATMTLHNTIVANSTGGDCVSFGGTINAANSLIEDGLTCVNGTNSNNLTGDPNLGPLQNNGGPTETHALLDGSIAFNAGANALAVDQNGSPLLYDQRGPGFPRVLNGTVDIGAVEIIDPTAVSLYSFRADGADFAMIGLGLLAAVGLLVATGYTLMYRRRA